GFGSSAMRTPVSKFLQNCSFTPVDVSPSTPFQRRDNDATFDERLADRHALSVATRPTPARENALRNVRFAKLREQAKNEFGGSRLERSQLISLNAST